MATGQTGYQKLGSNAARYMYDHDPADSTVATDVAWVDMRDYEHFLCMAFASALTGAGVTAFSIVGNTSSTGAGTDRVIVSHAVGSAPDAVGDFLHLECSAEQIASVGEANSEDLRYVSAKLTCANAADEAVVYYERALPRFPKANLTADHVA